MTRKWALVVALVPLIAGCGSTTLPKVGGASGPTSTISSRSFVGNVVDQPSVRTIHLKRGDALRWWVRPRGADPNELSIAVAATSALATPDSSNYDIEPWSEFFSDFSDYGTVQIGEALVQTNYEEDAAATVRLSFDPPTFSDYGRGWGAALKSGDWIVFIAPATGTYQLIVSGAGSFKGTYAVRAAPRHPKSSSSTSFDNSQGSNWTPAGWRDAISAQLGFVYAQSFYPSDGFFSDYGSGSARQYFNPWSHVAYVKGRLRQVP